MSERTMTAAGSVASHPAPRPPSYSLTAKTTGRIVGMLYVGGTTAGALSALMLTPVVESADLLQAAAERHDRTLLGAFLILVMGAALAAIPFLVFPILRAQSEPLALGYVVARGGLETAIYLTSTVSWVVLVALGGEYVVADGPVAAQRSTVGAAVLSVHDAVGDVALALVFALGALLFYLLLFRARLVPRWLSAWGLLAALLWMLAGVLAVFGLVDTRSPEQIVMALPIAVQEMVLAVWLIARGFPTHTAD